MKQWGCRCGGGAINSSIDGNRNRGAELVATDGGNETEAEMEPRKREWRRYMAATVVRHGGCGN